MFRDIFKTTVKKQERLGVGQVTPEPDRCVQCGICSFNCPANIDVRNYSRQGIPVSDSRCLTCGECVARCPRGVLHFARSLPKVDGPEGQG
jgi:ferredoxin